MKTENKMNKRIIIEGEKVHHVGYRPFLLAKAWELGIPNYFARNVKEGGMERVEISIGGEEEQIKEFLEFIKDNYPSKAKVSRVREGKLPERVIPIDKYDRVLVAEQQNTVVQTGLEMVGMQEKTVETQKETIDEVKTVGVKVDNVANKIGNFASETSQNFSILKEDYGKISHTMEKILEWLTQQQKDFTEAINRLTNAILKLVEKATK